MQFQIERIEDVGEAKNRVDKYRYALLYFYSDVFLGETKDLSSLNWEECIEARFFDGEKELRFFREDDSFIVSTVSGDEDAVEDMFFLDTRFKPQWTKVTVRRFLKYDEDGQAFVAATMLAGLER